MKTLAFLLLLLGVSPFLVSSQDSARPHAYHLKIEVPDMASTSTFKGSVQINLTVVSPTPSFVLHAEDLDVDVSSVSVLKKSRFSGWSAEEVSNVTLTNSILSISFLQPTSGTEYIISAQYQASFHNNLAGFAKVGYHFIKTQRYLGVTNLEPTNARKVFPCFDTPQHRATVTLEVTVNKNQTVLSNVKPTSIHNATSTTRTFLFNSAAMPVSKLAWVVLDSSHYILHSVNSSTTEVRARAPYPYSNHTAWSCTLTANLLDTLGSYTAQPYPFDKLDQVIVPEFSTGTTDGWGVITYSEESFLVTPERTSARDTQRVGMEVARGVVDQWFGAQVSMSSWDNTWLTRGFAEYLKYIASNKLPEMSSWELSEQLVVDLVQPALDLDVDSHALIVNSSLGEAVQVNQVYDDLTRYKGAAVIRMIHSIVGDKVFVEALRAFIQESLQSASDPANLWNILYEAAREENVDLAMQSIENIMAGWTQLAGHPVVNVAWNGTHFTMSQSMDNLWSIPITYMLQHKPEVVVKTWLHPGVTVTVGPTTAQWIVVNVNQTGFYRVNYDSQLWQLLQNQMSKLPRLLRAQILDDLFALVEAGVVSTDYLLQFSEFLRSETEYYPWCSALRNYQRFLDRLYGHSSHQLLQLHLLDLMKGVIDNVGLVSRPQDSHIDKLKRSLVLEQACALGHPVCLQKAVSILRSWMAGTYYDADLSTTLLCAGLSNSSSNMWRSVWNMYHFSVFPTVRASLLRSLTCSKDVLLMKQFLTNITSTSDPAVNNKDKAILLRTLASTSFGAELLLDWLLERLNDQIPKPVNESSTTTTSSTTTSSPPTTQHSTAVPNLSEVEPSDKVPAVESNQESAVDAVRKKRDATVPERLAEEDVSAILLYIVPKLTTLEQGAKLEAFFAKNTSELSASTRSLMQNSIKQIYEQSEWARLNNGNITTWLEDSVSTPASGSTDNIPTSSDPSSPSLSSSLHSYQYSSISLCIVATLLRVMFL